MTDLKTLSDAATQGGWAIKNKVGVLFGPDVQIAKFGDFLDDELVPFNGDRWNADAQLCATLVNAYRAGTIGDTAAAYERGMRAAAEVMRENAAQCVQAMRSRREPKPGSDFAMSLDGIEIAIGQLPTILAKLENK